MLPGALKLRWLGLGGQSAAVARRHAMCAGTKYPRATDTWHPSRHTSAATVVLKNDFLRRTSLSGTVPQIISASGTSPALGTSRPQGSWTFIPRSGSENGARGGGSGVESGQTSSVRLLLTRLRDSREDRGQLHTNLQASGGDSYTPGLARYGLIGPGNCSRSDESRAKVRRPG